MQRTAGLIIGTHDFKAFEGSGSPRAHTERTVYKSEIYKDGKDFLVFEVEADGFLRFMVRNIMGTLIAVGLGKISADKFKTILESKDRSQAGITAPPQGLFLVSVKY
jgi:tRNA pseudouridine38-40 synthase